MSETETGAEESAQKSSSTPPDPTPEPDCSAYPPPGDCPSDVGDLECTAKGDEAKATYSATFATDLTTAQTDYETTRAAYRTARHEVKLTVDDLANQIWHLVERIGCQIEQKRVRICLDEAFDDVLKELKCCPKPEACCATECAFPLDEIEDIDWTKLSITQLTTLIERIQVLITDYQARIEVAKKCFTDLKGEPAALRDRVQKAKDSVAEINSMLATTDAATLDLKTAYAKALVAKWRIGRIWGGFKQVQDFAECLCDALNCWRKGCKAVYELKGVEAVAICKRDARQKRCDKLHNETVEQILAGYDRRCGKKECPEPPDGNGDGDGDGGHDGDDCGCGGHHRHHHHKHRHQHHHHDCGCGCGCGCGCNEDDDDGGDHDPKPPKDRDCGCR